MRVDSSLGQRGRSAYEYRRDFCCTWEDVARATGYNTSSAAHEAAKKYARESGLPFPLPRASKGGKIYALRKIGYSWSKIARQYGESILVVQKASHKWATRNDKCWPPSV